MPERFSSAKTAMLAKKVLFFLIWIFKVSSFSHCYPLGYLGDCLWLQFLILEQFLSYGFLCSVKVALYNGASGLLPHLHWFFFSYCCIVSFSCLLIEHTICLPYALIILLGGLEYYYTYVPFYAKKKTYSISIPFLVKTYTYGMSLWPVKRW